MKIKYSFDNPWVKEKSLWYGDSTFRDFQTPFVQARKEKVHKYKNQNIEKFISNIEKLNLEYSKTKNEYITYYKQIGQLVSNPTEDDIQSVLSEANKKELNRIVGLIDSNKDFLRIAKANQLQWNKLDDEIEDFVFEINKMEGKNMHPDLVKALMFAESEMGTGKGYKYLIQNGSANARFQLNFGRVTDNHLYQKVVEKYRIPVDWRTNYLANGNKNDVMLAAGALMIKYHYAKRFPTNRHFTNRPWFNAVVAFKGVSAEGLRKAKLTWRLFMYGEHPYTHGIKLF